MKILKVLLVAVIGITLFGCNQSEDNSNIDLNQKNYDEIEKIVTDKGYTIEEISGLKKGQEVKKDYDNEVLARFGKIQGYLYEITNKWNDGLMEGPYTDKSKEYSVLPLKEMKAANKDTYEDSKHFSKYTFKLLKRVIFDCYYDEELNECYWEFDEEFGNSGVCESPLPKEYLETLKKDYNIKKSVTQKYPTQSEDDGWIQFRLPVLKEK